MGIPSIEPISQSYPVIIQNFYFNSPEEMLIALFFFLSFFLSSFLSFFVVIPFCFIFIFTWFLLWSYSLEAKVTLGES